MQGQNSRISAWIQRLARLSVFIFSLLLSVALANTVYHTWKKRDFLRAREAQLAAEIAKNDRLTKQFTVSQTDEFVEKVARDELGLSKPGETVVIIGSPAANRASSPSGELVNSDSPNWRQWWGLFFK